MRSVGFSPTIDELKRYLEQRSEYRPIVTASRDSGREARVAKKIGDCEPRRCLLFSNEMDVTSFSLASVES